MNLTFFDTQDRSNPSNGRVLGDDSELVQLLESLRDRAPFFVELDSENGYQLLVGVGGANGTVQYNRSDGDSAYLMAVEHLAATEPIGSLSDRYEHCLEFLIGNTPTPVPRRYRLSPERVKEVALYFRQTGEPSPAVLWEEI